MLTRRRVFSNIVIASGIGVLAVSRRSGATNRLETTSVRLVQDQSSCLAPEYVAEELLREEGFTDIQYAEVASDADDQKMIASGAADFALDFALKFITAIDAGEPLTVLSGVHT